MRIIGNVEIINNLTSTSADKPLSANMGRVLNENKLGFVRDLGANVNLNSLTEEGYYHQASNSSTSLALNYPVMKAGLLTVINREYIYQTYHTYENGGIFYRTFYNGKWYSWKKAVSSSPDVIAELGSGSNGFVGWDNVQGGWLRASVNGFLPNKPNDETSTHVGTSGWKFRHGHFVNMHADNLYSSGVNQNFRYSTAEQWTGQYWIDGAKIYTKTITINNGKTKDVRTSLSSLGLANAKNIIIDQSNSFRQYSGSGTYSAFNSFQPVNIYSNSSDYSVCYIDAATQLATIHSNTSVYAKYTITLRYTK